MNENPMKPGKFRTNSSMRTAAARTGSGANTKTKTAAARTGSGIMKRNFK